MMDPPVMTLIAGVEVEDVESVYMSNYQKGPSGRLPKIYADSSMAGLLKGLLMSL